MNRLEKEHLVDVFVGSAVTGVSWKNMCVRAPFVKVKVTDLTFCWRFKRVERFSSRAGIVTYQERLPFVGSVRGLLKVEVTERVYHSSSEVDQVLLELYNQGIEDVIGTAYVLERAQLLGMRGHYIWSVDGVKAAVDTAVQIAFEKKQDAQKANKLASILQTIHEGVIVTDEHGLVSEFNTSAEHILKNRPGDVMGKHAGRTAKHPAERGDRPAAGGVQQDSGGWER